MPCKWETHIHQRLSGYGPIRDKYYCQNPDSPMFGYETNMPCPFDKGCYEEAEPKSEVPSRCEYQMYQEIGYSSWVCPYAGGIISQDVCRRICRYCPKDDWEVLD